MVCLFAWTRGIPGFYRRRGWIDRVLNPIRVFLEPIVAEARMESRSLYESLEEPSD